MAGFCAAWAFSGMLKRRTTLVGWWWTPDQMQGMDNGPWTGPGGLGWFLGVWVVMMAAMMFPSVAPTVALYSRMTRQRSPLSPLLFAGGYLVTWALAGVVAFAIGVTVHAISADVFVWDRAGRWTAGGRVGFDGNFPFHVFSAYAQDEYQVTPKIVLTAGLFVLCDALDRRLRRWERGAR